MSSWSTIASILEPELVKRVRAGVKPVPTPMVNYTEWNLIFR